MAYLDVSPMVSALQKSPEEFEMDGSWLVHLPSRHCFQFDTTGRLAIRATCECASLAVRREQVSDLAARYADWQARYWQPFVINREFASHFAPRSAPMRMLIEAAARLHRRLMQTGHRPRRAGAVFAAE